MCFCSFLFVAYLVDKMCIACTLHLEQKSPSRSSRSCSTRYIGYITPHYNVEKKIYNVMTRVFAFYIANDSKRASKIN